MMDAPTPKQLHLADRERRLRERHEGDLRAMLKGPEGRRIAYWLLAEAGVWRSSFIAGQPDSTAKNEGRREMGLLLLDDLMAAKPEALLQMQNEYASEQKQFADEDAKLDKEAEEA